ncbi:hypothetical protein OG21DRAFT_1490984 [Imleria badia]|nr:hypothetical protein OG21DRAFT_1490984 [Imleria badia]
MGDEENTGDAQVLEAGDADDMGDAQENIEEPGELDTDEWEDLAEWQGMMQASKDDEKDDSEEDDGNASDSDDSDKNDADEHVVADEGEELDNDIYAQAGYGAL